MLAVPGIVDSFVPSASPTKFATVFGASFLNRRIVKVPSDVLKSRMFRIPRALSSEQASVLYGLDAQGVRGDCAASSLRVNRTPRLIR